MRRGLRYVCGLFHKTAEQLHPQLWESRPGYADPLSHDIIGDMSNFTAFSKEYLESIIEPFLPGGTGHITPIKYQAITPDIFVLMFRTTGKDGRNHFFVSMEYDHLAGIGVAERIIREWCGSEVLQLVTPSGTESKQQPMLEDVRVPTKEPYFAIMVVIDKPKDLGYWSDHVVLKPGDSIAKTLGDYLDKDQISFVRKIVGEQSVPQKKAPVVNTTERHFAVYVNPDGDVELFYN